MLSIAAVERDTGIGKDTLRVWERRYGFPVPERDVHGERIYPMSQVEKLRADGYNPRKYYEEDPELHQALTQIASGVFSPQEPGRYRNLFDALVNFGLSNNMQVVGHTLVWHSQTPSWVFEGEGGKPATKEELLKRMRDHIHAVAWAARARSSAQYPIV